MFKLVFILFYCGFFHSFSIVVLCAALCMFVLFCDLVFVNCQNMTNGRSFLHQNCHPFFKKNTKHLLVPASQKLFFLIQDKIKYPKKTRTLTSSLWALEYCDSHQTINSVNSVKIISRLIDNKNRSFSLKKFAKTVILVILSAVNPQRGKDCRWSG